MRDRLTRHHLPLLCGVIVSVGLLYFTRPYRDVLSRVSFATAYPAVVLLLATLLFGPWNLIRGKRNPVSSDLRRDVGVWAGLLALVHSGIGQCVHLRGRPWLYYVYEHRSQHLVPLRHDLFGFANFTGAVGSLIVLALLVTSNDRCLRGLGTAQWKRLQRWNYAACPLALAHTIAYQVSEKKTLAFLVVTAATAGVILLFQLRGVELRSRRS